ncbi:MAG: hypothetical protein O7B25_09155 [Gammaproteobacteria bacterium]|nr:hypothetical protein [Gammaproteobacteria bacterium]
MRGGTTIALATLALVLAASMVRAQETSAQEASAQEASAQETSAQPSGGRESAEPETSTQPSGERESAEPESSAAQNGVQESIEAILAEEDPALQEIEAQIQAQEFDYPILWLEELIAAVEHATHRYDSELIRPLTLLGDARAGKGDFAGALDNYARAVHLSRVNGGLVASAQVPIVYREANTHNALGDYASANDREEYAYYVLSHAHGPYDEEMLAGVFQLANWYSETNHIYPARALYQQAVNILAANSQQTSLAAIPAYEGVARTYRLERFPPFYNDNAFADVNPSYATSLSVNNFPAGERALQQIIQIRRAGDDVDPLILALAILDLADWYLLFDKTRRAYPLYEHVYALLADTEGFAVADYFAEPKLLYFPMPQAPRAPPVRVRGERSEGFVEISYLISKSGYAKSLKTVQAKPEGLMDFRVRKSLRLSRYRPILAEGLPVEKIDHTYRYDFAYFPKLKSSASPEPAEPASPSEASEPLEPSELSEAREDA